MLNWKNCVILMAVAVLTLTGCAAKEEAPAPEPVPEPAPVETAAAPATAVAQLMPRADMPDVGGSVTFTEIEGGVRINAEIHGAAAGTHGFHLHEIGDCSAEDFTSSGGHFNPSETPHGAPTDDERHAGDFGNLEVGDDGMGALQVASTLLAVNDGENGVVGRAVILHEGEDDLVSQPTGAAGGRIACGVVELMEDAS